MDQDVSANQKQPTGKKPSPTGVEERRSEDEVEEGQQPSFHKLDNKYSFRLIR